MPQSNQVQLKVARKSGFPQRHHWLGTADVGSLVPTLVQEVIPGSIVNLRAVHSIAMPPLASDAYMKLDYRTEAFFVPMRLLYGGFESWFTQRDYPFLDDDGSVGSFVAGLPFVRQYDYANNLQDMGPGTLTDYLGYKSGPDELADGTNFVDFTLLPFLAYHKIWDDWYRAPSVQKSCFARFSNGSDVQVNALPSGVCVLPYVTLQDDISKLEFSHGSDSDDIFDMADGHSLFVIRQRNFGFDYFTNALPTAQLGDAVKVTADSAGQFSIAQFRALNSMQRFKERNNIAGNRYVDTLKARYGVDLSNGVAQRSLFLGSAVYDVYNKTVDVSGSNTPPSSSLPWASAAGAQLGRAYAGGQDKLIDEFHVQEPGYIFVIGSLVPRVSYGSGVRKLLTRYTKPGCITDMANAELQNVGVEPIYQYELVTRSAFGGDNPDGPERVFGYTDRYASFMTMEDEIHGLFYGGNNLSIMAPQRYFVESSRPVISASFLEIPMDYLDNVTTVNAAIRRFGYWIDADFDLRVVAPLMSPGTLPSLENPAYEHGDTVTVHRGGFRL